MILTAHQPQYLPWLGLFDKISQADVFVSFDEVQYCPRDYINRNRIKTANGIQWLTVPVHSRGHRDKAICDIEIDNSTHWGKKHWRTIELAYGKSSYFKKYASGLNSFYWRTWRYLFDLNESMLMWFLRILGIKIEFLRASDFAFRGAKSDLVLDMCQQLGAKTFIFGACGRDYAKVEDFEKAGIEVRFQEYRHPVYPQLHGDFVSHLSVLDLLFNAGEQSSEIIRTGGDSFGSSCVYSCAGKQ